MKDIKLAAGQGLYDGQGNIVTVFNPRFSEVAFSTGYNPNSTHRGGSGGQSQNAGRETSLANRDRIKAMWDARDLCQYQWIGGVIGRIVNYVCGTITNHANSGDPELNKIYDDYFHGWCGDLPAQDGTTRCDITGRHRFSKLVQLAFTGFLVDGDSGIVEVDPAYSPNGEFCVQLISADRIGNPQESDTNENYIGGITIDPLTGRVVSYRTFRRTKNNQYVDKREVEPRAFIHVFDPEAGDEYRGRTKLLRLLNDARDIKEWIDAEKVSMKAQSQFTALVGTKDPFTNTGPGAWDGKTAAGTPSQEAAWGKILKMGEGEMFQMVTPSARPSGSTMVFVQTLIRRMAHSMKLSYGFLWDLASLGGVSQRIELQGDLRTIQGWQNNIIVQKILTRIRNKVIAFGVARKEIPASPGQFNSAWHFGPWITTDAGYEMQNDIHGVQTGIFPVSDVTSKYGYTPQEVFQSNAQAANTAISEGAKAGLPAEVFARGLYSDITAQKAAYLSPTPQPPPPPVSIQAIGDKGVKQLTDILVAVGEGKMDRDSAIQTLMQVFGLPQGEAEKIVPQEPTTEDLNREAGLTPEGEHAPESNQPPKKK
jgi:capsid protein